MVTFKRGMIEICNNKDIPEGIYKGSGVVQTYGKCKAVIA